MRFLRRTGSLAAVTCAVLALSGCSGERWEDAPHLTEVQTQQRAQMLSPSRSLFEIELRSRTVLPTCGDSPAEQQTTCVDGDSIQLQASELPDVLDRNYLSMIWDAEGKVQEISGVTKLSWAAWTLEMLKTKFGKPDYRGPDRLPGYDRWEWTYKDAEVVYLGTEQYVIVSLTTAEQAHLKDLEIQREIEEQAKKNAQKRAL